MHLVKTSTLSRLLPVVRDSNPRLGQFGLNAGTAPKWIPHRCCQLRHSTRLFHPFVHHNFKLGSLLTGGQFGVS